MKTSSAVEKIRKNFERRVKAGTLVESPASRDFLARRALGANSLRSPDDTNDSLRQ